MNQLVDIAAPSTIVRRRRKMLVADLLCGAGGSSTGAQRALTELGLEMDLVAVNHWPVAIATHEKNHPTARHYVQDIATVRPSALVPEGYLDLLMASPTCTHHSVARGGKPTSDQQRSDPWHINTWLTELRVKRIIIENVWEFIGWGPVDHRTGKPIKSRKGEYFNAWIESLKRLGFNLEWRKLNAADYGDATTRNRFILMGRSDKKKVSWPMPTHAKRGAPASEGLFAGELKTWRPAAEIIDWNIKGRSIFNRKKDLAPKTLMRIYAGAVKLNWPEPFIVVLRNHMDAQGIDLPIPTIAAKGNHIGIAEPVVISTAHGVDAGERDPHSRRARSVADPLGAIHANGGNFAVAEPAIVNMKGQSTATSTGEPLPSMTAHAAHLYSAEPVILSSGSYGAARGTSDPLPTITTGGAGVEERPGCARPMLVEPFVLSQASGGAPRAVSDPLPTATTGGAGGAHALIAPYYGSGSGETCTSSDQPLPTITSKDRFSLVVPVTHTQGSNSARDVAEPLPTITTAKGGEFAVVMPVTHAGGVDRAGSAADPLPTITGANRGELAVADLGEGYDILFRMLEPEELAAAMGFSDNDVAYEFTGTKTERVKQVGNAVSVAKMRACVRALMQDSAL